ncbi:MAG: 2-C-methyl-D-erythritol 2,4-cyclodiphosphate synthase [Desulfobacterales bacterium]
MRVGLGYDVHRLVKGRKLVLGGISIDFEKGLEGHSDADVVVHAVCDAILGASGLNDIGYWFPDTDPAYHGIYSIELLKKCLEMAKNSGFSIQNLDITIFAERPKISPHREAMTKKIAETLEMEPGRVNIKATTTEGLGMIGKGEGIGAMCIVLME